MYEEPRVALRLTRGGKFTSGKARCRRPAGHDRGVKNCPRDGCHKGDGLLWDALVTRYSSRVARIQSSKKLSER